MGFRADFAERSPQALAALLRALYKASQWAGDPRNHEELSQLLATPAYLGVPAGIIARALSGNLVRRQGAAAGGIVGGGRDRNGRCPEVVLVVR